MDIVEEVTSQVPFDEGIAVALGSRESAKVLDGGHGLTPVHGKNQAPWKMPLQVGAEGRARALGYVVEEDAPGTYGRERMDTFLAQFIEGTKGQAFEAGEHFLNTGFRNGKARADKS